MSAVEIHEYTYSGRRTSPRAGTSPRVGQRTPPPDPAPSVGSSSSAPGSRADRLARFKARRSSRSQSRPMEGSVDEAIAPLGDASPQLTVHDHDGPYHRSYLAVPHLPSQHEAPAPPPEPPVPAPPVMPPLPDELEHPTAPEVIPELQHHRDFGLRLLGEATSKGTVDLVHHPAEVPSPSPAPRDTRSEDPPVSPVKGGELPQDQPLANDDDDEEERECTPVLRIFTAPPEHTLRELEAARRHQLHQQWLSGLNTVAAIMHRSAVRAASRHWGDAEDAIAKHTAGEIKSRAVRAEHTAAVGRAASERHLLEADLASVRAQLAGLKEQHEGRLAAAEQRREREQRFLRASYEAEMGTLRRTLASITAAPSLRAEDLSIPREEPVPVPPFPQLELEGMEALTASAAHDHATALEHIHDAPTLEPCAPSLGPQGSTPSAEENHPAQLPADVPIARAPSPEPRVNHSAHHSTPSSHSTPGDDELPLDRDLLGGSHSSAEVGPAEAPKLASPVLVVEEFPVGAAASPSPARPSQARAAASAERRPSMPSSGGPASGPPSSVWRKGPAYVQPRPPTDIRSPGPRAPWQQQFLTLRRGKVFAARSASTEAPPQLLALSGIRRVRVSQPLTVPACRPPCFGVVLEGQHGSWELAWPTREERQAWFDALVAARPVINPAPGTAEFRRSLSAQRTAGSPPALRRSLSMR